MIDWQKQYGKQGLVVIAVTPKYHPASHKMLKKIVEGMGINYKIAQWEKEQSKLPKPLSLVPGYPASLLIDRNGRLRGAVFGPLLMQLEKDLKSALKEKPQSPAQKPENKPTTKKTKGQK